MVRIRKLADRFDDPGFRRTLERLLEEHRSTTLPNEVALDAAAQITPADIDAALSLWDEAQRRAGTGLDGLLDAKGIERDG